MALAETLILYIGPAIAKSIIKNWLGDNLPANVLASLVDATKNEAGQTLIGKQASDKIDKIAKDISSKLKPLVQSGEYKLSNDQIFVVGQEVAVTLGSAQISTDVLISLGLNVHKLYKHLLNSQKNATKNLSENESRAYEFLIYEISKQIIDISTELESYERTLSAKLLDSQEQILNQLEKLTKIPEANHSRFEKNYCSVIKQQLDKFEIFGLPQLDTISRKQSLSIAYVTLDVERRKSNHVDPDSEQKDANTIAERDRTYSRFQKGGQEEQEPEPVDNLLLNSRRIVIVGDAGSGKSTLMQWVAIRSAGKDFKENLFSLNNTVPFYIRLREHVNSGFPKTEDFPSQIARMIAGDMPRGWVHEQLDSGRAFILIDGVDELPLSQRNEMLQGLKQLLGSYPLARYIVTSRPSALKPEDWMEWSDWVKEENFSEVSLRPMSPEHVGIFIDQWHKAFSQATNDLNEASELDAIGSSLKRLLKHRPPLRRLAANPLLCAMICALHKDRQQNLPAERIELYKACVEMLLSRRDEGRKITYSDYIELSSSQKLSLIQGFAYWLIRNGYSDAECVDADKYFSEKLLGMNSTNLNGDLVRKLFVERANLLREPVLGRVDFAHRTFQEFLAAQAAAKVGDIGVLLKNSRDDQWREVIILAAGETRPKETEKLIRGLINKASKLKANNRRNQLILLAVSCLETCIELPPDVRNLVLETAKNVVPPKNNDEAKMIASAGDPAVDLLIYKPEFNDDIQHCIRTLGMIGTDKALRTIKGYCESANHARRIDFALGEVWENFDRELYAKTIFPVCKNLHLRNIQSFAHLELLGQIKSLNLSSGSRITDLKPLGELTTLEELFLSEFDLKELHSIENLKNLKVFWMQNFKNLDNLEVVSKFINLEDILLHNCSKITDLSPLGRLPALAGMLLSEPNPQAVESLHKLTNLKRIQLHTSEGKLDIDSCLEELSVMINLEEITIGDRVRYKQSNSQANRKTDEKLRERIMSLKLPNLSKLRINRQSYDLKQTISNTETKK